MDETAHAVLPAEGSTDQRPWVVAVGASAGGLEALQQFFADLPALSGAAFVVIQHLAPDHKSLMAELLTRHTALKVITAVEGMALEADVVCLMPPGVSMSMEGRTLHLAPRPSQGLALPIDQFFQSMATHLAERSIGVVLSGSGSDGSLGAAALRAAGGFVLVQSPETARFDSMPRSVLINTRADAVQPPGALAQTVLQIVHGSSDRLAGGELVASHQLRPALQRLFDALFSHSGIDFNKYKLPTVMRRIERRMLVSHIPSVSDYADRIEQDPDELEDLRREMLIPVTGFFRDPAAFDALTREVLLPMLRDRPASKPVRVWSAGCASGEEAYSLAMALQEACEQLGHWPGVKVFATDVDPRVLEIAATGNYPASIAEHLGQERSLRFFTRQGERMLVKPELRQLVLFARHNLLDDAPFTKMDLVVCRNTLIYFQAEAQERVMRRLQYALVPRGVLFLGSSESLGALQPDFSTLDNSLKLYRLERPVMTALALHDGFGRSLPMAQGRRNAVDTRPGRNQNLIDAGLAQLVQDYLPASLLVNGQRQLVHAWGPTRRFLRVPEGAGTLDAFRLMPDRLGPIAAHAQQQALLLREPFRAAPVLLDLDGQSCLVGVRARPMQVEGADDCVLLTLEELNLPAPIPARAALADLVPSDAVQMLERELQATRQSLQTTIEDLESANEELQSSNEELMSSNEELQSTNEELQSVNEELYTVNAEFNAKLDALGALNADLEGMAQATGIATLFVDHHLAIVRCTPEAAMLFRLRNSDLGRSIEDFNSLLVYPELPADLLQTLDSGEVVEREVTGPHGTLYLARVLSYASRPGALRRAVVSFIDITRVRDARRLQSLIDSLPEHIAVLDRQGTIRQVNQAWVDFARCNGGEAELSCQVGANYLGVLARSDDAEARQVLSALQDVMNGRSPSYTRTYPCHGPEEQRWYVMHARPLLAPELGLVITHFNVTDCMLASAQVHKQ
jgi:two-component system CheB/CheR fusion protein